MYKVAVLTINDKYAMEKSEDKCGRIILDLVKGLPAEVVKYEVIPRRADLIKERLTVYADNMGVDLVLTDGGTGFTAKDITPELTREVIEKETPGISEAMRFEGFKSTQKAMLSRGISGIRGKTLIINLPGSSRGTKESLEAILEGLPHGLDMLAKREN